MAYQKKNATGVIYHLKGNKMMKIMLFAAITLLSSPVLAADVTLCSGRPQGIYDNIMQTVGNELQGNGHTVTVLNLKGSEAILNALNTGQCAYGPAQKDVYYKMTKQSPALNANLIPVNVLYNEVMQMFCSESSGIDELEEIDETTTVITDSLGSGSAISWEAMVAIEKEHGGEDDWTKAQISFTPLDEAQASIALGNADCAFGVGGIGTPWANTLNESGTIPVYIYDGDLNDLVVGKSPLYTPTRVAKAQSGYSTKFDTYLIPAVLFRSQKAGQIDPQVDSIVKRLAGQVGNKYNTIK